MSQIEIVPVIPSDKAKAIQLDKNSYKLFECFQNSNEFAGSFRKQGIRIFIAARLHSMWSSKRYNCKASKVHFRITTCESSWNRQNETVSSKLLLFE